LFTLIPAFGVCSFINVLSLSISLLSISYTASKPLSFNIFSASFKDFPSTSGVCTSSTISTSSPVLFTSKYGNTSDKICPPTGAATPPACFILSLHLF